MKLYTVIITLVCLFGAVRSQTYVAVNSNQPALLLADAGIDRSICSGDSVTIGGTPAGNGGTPSYTFNWSSTGPMTSNTSGNPMAFPSATTSYILTVTDSRGCTALDTALVTVDTCVGIADPIFPYSVSIFPNPNFGDFTIVTDGDALDADLWVKISDPTGKLIQEKNLGKQSGRKETPFSLQGISRGTYLIELQSGEKKFVRRMIIQ